MKSKAYLAEVSGRRIKQAMPINNPKHLSDDLVYKICSECSAIIKETWDHNKNCSLYENEVLAAWVYQGIKDNE